MRPEMTFNRNESLFRHEKIFCLRYFSGSELYECYYGLRGFQADFQVYIFLLMCFVEQ